MTAPSLDAARVAVLVAHPDDETLWCGGTLLLHPAPEKMIGALCRASDSDRAPKFARAVTALGAKCGMMDLDDGPEQLPLDRGALRNALRSLIGERGFDLVITHSPRGEYTRHVRHEEVGAAVLEMWRDGELRANELWLFAYEDGQRSHLPRAVSTADLTLDLPDELWSQKARLITDVYGFASESWEARVTPRREAFWRVTSTSDALARLDD